MLPQTSLTEEPSYNVLQVRWCRKLCFHRLLRKERTANLTPQSRLVQPTHRPVAPHAAAAPGSTRRTAPVGRGAEARSTPGPLRRTAAAVCTFQAPWPMVKSSIWKVITPFPAASTRRTGGGSTIIHELVVLLPSLSYCSLLMCLQAGCFAKGPKKSIDIFLSNWDLNLTSNNEFSI